MWSEEEEAEDGAYDYDDNDNDDNDNNDNDNDDGDHDRDDDDGDDNNDDDDDATQTPPCWDEREEGDIEHEEEEEEEGDTLGEGRPVSQEVPRSLHSQRMELLGQDREEREERRRKFKEGRNAADLLPFEMVDHIISVLDNGVDVRSAMRTCKFWYSVVSGRDTLLLRAAIGGERSGKGWELWYDSDLLTRPPAYLMLAFVNLSLFEKNEWRKGLISKLRGRGLPFRSSLPLLLRYLTLYPNKVDHRSKVSPTSPARQSFCYKGKLISDIIRRAHTHWGVGCLCSPSGVMIDLMAQDPLCYACCYGDTLSVAQLTQYAIARAHDPADGDGGCGGRSSGRRCSLDQHLRDNNLISLLRPDGGYTGAVKCLRLSPLQFASLRPRTIGTALRLMGRSRGKDGTAAVPSSSWNACPQYEEQSSRKECGRVPHCDLVMPPVLSVLLQHSLRCSNEQLSGKLDDALELVNELKARGLPFDRVDTNGDGVITTLLRAFCALAADRIPLYRQRCDEINASLTSLIVRCIDHGASYYRANNPIVDCFTPMQTINPRGDGGQFGTDSHDFVLKQVKTVSLMVTKSVTLGRRTNCGAVGDGDSAAAAAGGGDSGGRGKNLR